MTDTSDSLWATWNAWKLWAYSYAETGLCEMCGEIDGHRIVDEGIPTERPCLVGAFETALARLQAVEANWRHMRRWASGYNVLSSEQWQGAVVRMCDEALPREEKPHD